MHASLKTVVILTAITALTSSCSQGLRILFFNNSGEAITLRFESDEISIIRTLDVGEQTTIVYESPAKIAMSIHDCEFSYELPPYDQSYDRFIPSPRERPYWIELQIQADHRFYIVPAGSQRPVADNDLTDQPEPFFPLQPSDHSCGET